MTDAVILLTGSSSGIGEACAAELAACGARVILHGRSADVLGAVAAGLGAKVVAADLRAPLQLTRALLPDMIARGSDLLAFVASIAGLTGVGCEAVYAATKAGLITFADSLRLELHGTGVGVTIISPGAVRTNFFERRGTPYGRRIPRPMPPQRVAAAVVRRLERGSGHTILPRWLALAPATRAVAPRMFETLNRRMG